MLIALFRRSRSKQPLGHGAVYPPPRRVPNAYSVTYKTSLLGGVGGPGIREDIGKSRASGNLNSDIRYSLWPGASSGGCRRLVLSFGANDCEAKLGWVRLEQIWEMLRPLELNATTSLAVPRDCDLVDEINKGNQVTGCIPVRYLYGSVCVRRPALL